jgi:hypothetical protein
MYTYTIEEYLSPRKWPSDVRIEAKSEEAVITHLQKKLTRGCVKLKKGADLGHIFLNTEELRAYVWDRNGNKIADLRCSIHTGESEVVS